MKGKEDSAALYFEGTGKSFITFTGTPAAGQYSVDMAAPGQFASADDCKAEWFIAAREGYEVGNEENCLILKESVAEITTRTIIVKANDQTVFVGNPLDKTKVTVGGEDGLANGHTITVVFQDGISTNVPGKQELIIKSVLIKDEANKDVTENYSIIIDNSEPATLTVLEEEIVDKTAPTLEYRIGGNGWKVFSCHASFDLFCKDDQVVEIKCSDASSGVKNVKYYISDKVITDFSKVNWKDYKDPLNLNETGIYFIYAYAEDNAGNVTEEGLTTEGIVIYEDSRAVTEEITYFSKANQDKTAEVKLNGNKIKSITCEGIPLTEKSDYMVDSVTGIITFQASWLDTFAAKATPYTLCVSYYPMGITDKNAASLATTTINLKVSTKNDEENQDSPPGSGDATEGGETAAPGSGDATEGGTAAPGSGASTDKYTGLKKVDGTWYYVTGNEINTGFNGLVKNNGQWFYVEKGKLNWNYTGLCKRNGSWYYVKNGVVDFKYTGLCKRNGQWFYVKSGVVDFKYTGLCKRNGQWFYVKSGVVNFKYTGLCKRNGQWFYVKSGVVNFKYTGLCKRNGQWFYVKNGVVNFKYTGYTNYNGSRWYVKNGVMVKKA